MLTKRGRKFKAPNIQNINRKLHEIGLDIEYVTRKEDIIIYLTYYLTCMTVEQLCFLFDNLETSIKTSIARIIKSGGDDIVEIRRDEVNNLYYLPTRKTLSEINKYREVEKKRNYKNIKHLSKINDFYLTLFKSNSDKVTIKYEQYLENGVFEESIVRADAIINVEKDENAYEFVIEQDNMTEKVTKIYNKVENYYNTILHGKFCPEKTRYFYFRFDILFNKNNLAKYENILNKSKKYKELMNEIKEIQGFYDDVRNNNGTNEHFKSRTSTYEVEYSNENNILMKNISFRKSELLKNLYRFKRSVRIELSCKSLRDRIDKVTAAMLKDFKVRAFDTDSDNTLFNDITRQNRFGAIYSTMEAQDVLLRTNILCGDIKIDYILRNILFGSSYREEHYLISIIKQSLGHNGINSDSLKVKQVFKTIGHQTLCFSNYCNVHLNNKHYDLDCILLMPTISVSDFCRIEYLLNELKQIEDSFINTPFFYILTTDKQSLSFYKEKIRELAISKARFFICPITINEIDDELTPVTL